ncbi:hypothetical protein EYF80_019519 [Liparis tanakae]|uniref:Uncharacterized protein n=1 Tax=Liparis tanakae TaxID=230148 RepID=A0A4Z2HYB2_9TELE|nr:hypothetical protein EYF80_019519 [Liparis tanakae]
MVISPPLSKQNKNATGRPGGERTLETVPFSSTSRGALLLTGWGSGASRHRQQKRPEKRPLLLGFLEDREGAEPAEERGGHKDVVYVRFDSAHLAPPLEALRGFPLLLVTELTSTRPRDSRSLCVVTLCGALYAALPLCVRT